MSAWDRQPSTVTGETRTIDQGLRSHMLKVYNYMASGVLLTGVIAYLASNSEAFINMMLVQGADGRMGMSPLAWIVMLAPVAMVFFMMFKLHTMSTQALKTTFWAYAGLMGLSLYWVLLAFTGESVLRVFFITAGTFGLLSMYGYTTKKDLSSWGTFLIVGVWAVFLVSLVNMFMHVSGLQMILSYVGVFLALGFTAYDTQRIKDIYYMSGGSQEVIARSSIMAALKLYMDFVYLFVNLLQILGDRR